MTQLEPTRHAKRDGAEAPMHPLPDRLQRLEAISSTRGMNAHDFSVSVFDGDEKINPLFLEGERLAHVRSPHFIDLVGDDGSVVRLLLVAPDAMGREQAVLSHHPRTRRGSRNPVNAQSRPVWIAFAVKVYASISLR